MTEAVIRSRSIVRLIVLAVVAGTPRPSAAQAELSVLEGRLSLLENRFQSTVLANHEPRLANALQRIEELEKRVLTLEQRLAALAREIGKGSIVPDTTPLTVRAPFVVVDERGQPVLRVESTAQGPTLTMLGRDSRRAFLSSSSLLINSGTGSPGGVRVGVGTRGHGFLFLVRQGGATAADVGFDQTTERLGFRLYANNQIAAELAVEKSGAGSGSLRLGDGKGKFPAELAANARNEMALKLRGASGEVVAGLGVNPNGGGGGALQIADRTGAVLASVESKGGAGHVNVFGSDGNARANMGSEPDGRGFLRIGSSKNVEAASLSVSPTTGSGLLQTKNEAGIGVTIGTNVGEGGRLLGDLCVNSTLQKGTCFSALAKKNFIIYY